MNCKSLVRCACVAIPVVLGCGGGGGGPSAPDEPPAPSIQSVDPNPVRAGGQLIIRGSNLLGSSPSIQPAQGPEVILDNRVLVPTTVTNTEVVVVVPLDVEPGSHTLRFQTSGGSVTNTITLQVHIFTVTGTYRAEGPRTTDSCGVDDTPVGTVEDFEVSLTDNRPTVSIRVGAFRFNGVLGNGGDFSGQFQETDVGTGLVSTVSLNGNMIAADEDLAGFTGFLELSFSGGVLLPCAVRWSLIGARLTTIATAKIPAEVPLDQGRRNVVMEMLRK